MIVREKLHILFTFFVILFIGIYGMNAQCTQGTVTTFQKVFGGNGNERGHSVIQTNDGGYAVVGETNSFGAGNKDFFVTKLNSFGIIQWTKTYGTTALEDGNSLSITQTLDGGYLIAGHTPGLDGYILKLDGLGTVQWERNTLGSTIRNLKELANGDFIFTGNAYTLGPGIIASFVVRMTSAGTVLWSKSYGGNVVDQATNVMEIPGGDLIIASHTNSFGVGGTDGLLMRLDNLGNVVWTKYYGGAVTEAYYSTSMLSDGNMVGVGLTNSYGVGNDDIILSKIDLNGNIIWTKTFGGTNIDRGEHVEENQNGEIVFSGYTDSFGGNFNLLLGATDLNGNLLWSKKYGGTNLDEIDRWSKPHQITQDNGIIIVGATNSFSGGGEDVYLIKTNECGESFCNEQDINLLATTPNIAVGNVNITTNLGGSIIIPNSSSSTINFTENFLCVDTVQISVACNLTANFSSLSFCLGDSTYFMDLSIDNVGNIVNWQWYFGDGDSIVGVQNPSHLYSSSGNYNVALVVTNDSNCVDSITFPLTINPVFSINQNTSICVNDSIFLEGGFQTTAGIYIDSLQTVAGCDSIITTTLSINPIATSNQNQTICQGDSVLFVGVFYNSAGSYTDTLQTFLGCDSLITLNLTVNPSFQFSLNQTICSGDSVFIAGAFQTTSGVYSDTLQTILLCDSIIITTLTVGNVYNDTINRSICQGDSIFLGGIFQTTTGVYTDSLQTAMGCDSIVITSLSIDTMINLIVSNDTTVSPCNTVQLFVTGGSSYIWAPSTGLSCTNCASPTVFPTVTITYTVTDISNSCAPSNSVTITVEGESDFFIPNVFTPNGDDNNDGFNVKSTCIYSLEKKIYNRWGLLLFESTQINEEWDGRTRTGEKVPEGTYFYIIKVGMYQNSDEILETFTGTLTLLR